MCEFCDIYKYARKSAKIYKDKGMTPHFRVKLMEYYTKNRVKQGEYVYKGVKLKYCPQCGKKLR